jgi:RHS repeat-associated protein
MKSLPVKLAGLVLAALIVLPAQARAQTEQVEYYALDAIGSVRVVFDASGAVVARLDYEPFGKELSSAKGPDRKFAKLFRDSEAGLDYAEARSYQVRTGRFSSPDPVNAGLTDPQRWNRYGYASNNPLMFVDPHGLFSEVPEGGLAFTDEISVVGALSFIDYSPFGSAIPIMPWGQTGWNQGGRGKPNTGTGQTQPTTPATPAGNPPANPSPPAGPPGAPTVDPNRTCAGTARILKGNPRTIGRPGGFSGATVGDIPVTADSAAIIPRQWMTARAVLRSFLDNISGSFPGGGFSRVRDTVGGEPPSRPVLWPKGSVQDALMFLNPNKLIVELPNGAQDIESTTITLSVPSSLPCPAGTR